MNIKYTVLDATKAGSLRSEMEDAACPDQGVSRTDDTFVCAVADGATQGSHSGPWARFLCETFVAAGAARPPEAVLEGVVESARSRFTAWEKDYVKDRTTAGRPLQWFEEEVIGSGAFATLVGLHLTPKTEAGATFRAAAVGDSCLFVVRDGQVATSFPLTDPAQFAGAPLLIASLAARNSGMQGGIRHISGELAVGDGIFLCTDALSAWILKEEARGGRPVPRLLDVLAGGTEALAAFLAELRRDKSIRNDDVTLAHVALEG